MDSPTNSPPDKASESLWFGLGSAGLTTVSAGLALARLIPDDAPAVVALLLSGVVLALNLAVIHLCRNALECWATSGARRATVGGTAVLGPFLTACAWTTNGWFLLVWSVVLLAGCAAAIVHWSASLQPRGVQPVAPRESRSPVGGGESDDAEPWTSEMRSRDDWTQRIVRQGVGAGEMIHVEWRIEFSPGQQQLAVHLPIAPPLSAIPVVECEPLEGADVELSVGAAYPYGVRIDARRTGSAAGAAQCLIGAIISAAEVEAATAA